MLLFFDNVAISLVTLLAGKLNKNESVYQITRHFDFNLKPPLPSPNPPSLRVLKYIQSLILLKQNCR